MARVVIIGIPMAYFFRREHLVRWPNIRCKMVRWGETVPRVTAFAITCGCGVASDQFTHSVGRCGDVYCGVALADGGGAEGCVTG